MAQSSPTSLASDPRHRWLRRAAVAAGVLVALIAIAWIAVPPIVRSQLETRLSEALARKATVESVSFDPFALRVTVRKLAIADAPGAAPLFAFDELIADLSFASLWHRAPVLDALRIVRPALLLSRDARGRYNVQDLLDRASEEPDAPPPRFSLNNIEVDGGVLTFDDGMVGRKHRLESLNLGVPFLSSLPYHTDVRVTPRADGTLNGSSFALGGTTAPFAERREAALDIDFDALPLKDYLAYLPARPLVDLASGTLTTRLKVVFVDGKLGERRLELRGDVHIDGPAVKRGDGTTLAAAERIAVTLDRVDVFGRDARIAVLVLEAPTADVRRLADGTLELAHPLFATTPRPATRAQAAGAPSAPEKPWTIAVAKATIARGTVVLTDAGSSFRSTLADIAVDATNLSTRAGEKAHVALAFMSADRIASFKGEADVEPRLPAVTGTFELRRFSLALLFPYYKDALAADVQSGSFDYASRFAFGAGRKLNFTDGVASIDDLRLTLPGARDPLWHVPNLAATGVDVDVDARKVAIREVQSRGASLRFARKRAGSLDAVGLMKTTRTTGTAADDRTWALAVKRLTLERVALDIEDRVPRTAVKLALRDVSLVVDDYSNARGSRSAATFRARVGERGRLSFAGPLATNPFAIGGELDAEGLDLVPIKPYVESRVDVVLTSGTLAAKGRLSVDASEGDERKATWKGSVTISDFAALDRPTSSDLARWKSLAFEDVDVVSVPLRVSVGRIGVEDYYARVIVYEDGTLNLTRLLAPGAAPRPTPDAKPAVLDAVAPSDRAPRPVSIGRIELVRGIVAFSDLFVKPNYSTNLTDVAGTVGAMSAGQAGDIAIAARIDKTAPVEVAGRLQPFAKELALDIVAKARDVDLPPLSPYSLKYAGHAIEKGKLTFDVHYKVDHRRLTAENHLVFDQLTLNRDRVDGPMATKQSMLLAVDLLTDRRGVIDIRVPISGSLDDPQFSVGGHLGQGIVSLIAKAATAPFALLAAPFGRSGEELSTLPFASGSAALGTEARQRVDLLGKALADHPALKLDIAGRADPAGDRDALRNAAVETAMKREKMKSLASAGSAPSSVDLVTIGPDERTHWLMAAYREAPIEERPRNLGGTLTDVSPSEMEAMLLADAKVDDEALRRLANARAQAVRDALTAQGVAGERLFVTAPRLAGEGSASAGGSAAPPPAALPPARVDLALR